MITFEWDEEKNRRNPTKHGVSFEEAKAVFSDRFVLETFDDRFDYGEARVISVGMTAKGLLAVVDTQREQNCGIVSARRATMQKADAYLENRS